MPGRPWPPVISSAATSAMNDAAGDASCHNVYRPLRSLFGCAPVAGDSNCLVHALGDLDARDGAALRNEVAAFMVEKACSQEGFEDGWKEVVGCTPPLPPPLS